ncbi:uncharacterized protein BO87DRAFT_409906 [Aspergillus neoniger CBS 115656]|uniref:Uncharacterized protein n=1 Tax=Aspergillus neoniger (strain CBS 115656) TaxID=1448310 RepID=A0A318Y9T8_ASPNB|nr:hypothetical protein BO87DRAFT_409906 [Aspergillus neoniger CBS 115656]PYH30337.1 hypothetical protein BO87DRAFT_409906 [Aspergillus neoniger CBS 115656]
MMALRKVHIPAILGSRDEKDDGEGLQSDAVTGKLLSAYRRACFAYRADTTPPDWFTSKDDSEAIVTPLDRRAARWITPKKTAGTWTSLGVSQCARASAMQQANLTVGGGAARVKHRLINFNSGFFTAMNCP